MEIRGNLCMCEMWDAHECFLLPTLGSAAVVAAALPCCCCYCCCRAQYIIGVTVRPWVKLQDASRPSIGHTVAAQFRLSWPERGVLAHATVLLQNTAAALSEPIGSVLLERTNT